MKKRLFFALLTTLGLTSTALSQPVVQAPDDLGPLTERWAWALDQSDGQTAWVGYSIFRMMSMNSWMGSWSSGGNPGPSLSMLVYGEEREPTPEAWQRQHDGGPSVQSLREVAFLFEVRDGQVVDVSVSNVSLHVRLGGRPLYWLGTPEADPSLALLTDLYDEASREKTREGAIMAASLHDDVEVLPLLRRALADDASERVRATAAFWVGQHGGAGALDLLRQAVERDRSGEVREKAIFAISQIDTDAATQALIDYARGAGDPEVREKAVFWLGQKASEIAVEALSDIAFDGEETEVQKQAIFAISQLDADDGIPLLIDIARTHENPEVRKQAIFWLGQSDDERALEALIAFVEGR